MRKAVCTVVFVLAAVFLAGGLLTTSHAADEIEYRVSPYAFLPALDVDSTVAGQTVPVDMDFGDVWDSFDVVGFSLRGEAWNGAYGGVTDFSYVDLDGDFGPGDSVNVQIREWFWDWLFGYRWIKPGNFTRPTSLDITTGLRFHGLKQEIRTPATPTLGGDEEWVDIMIGGRAIHPLSESWLLSLRGDIGGFDLTDGTKLNWSATGGIGWEFVRSWQALLGYRVYGIDYETGRGLNNFGIDGIEHGLWLGVSWAPYPSSSP